jgi:hypothetical protein
LSAANRIGGGDVLAAPPLAAARRVTIKVRSNTAALP